MTYIKSIGIPVLIGVTGLLTMSLIAWLLQSGQIAAWKISSVKVINTTFTMQMMVLPVSFLAIVLLFFYNRSRFRKFFRLGMNAAGSGQWNSYGPVIAIAFTAGNALLMSSAVISEKGSFNAGFVSLLPLVLLFAITNAWSEEIFSRFVIVAGLDGKLKPATICWISAIIFGLPHFFGTPSGIFGVITSGILGWLMAKSVIETRGLGWAVLIHFLQDVIIFGAGAMIIAGGSK